MRTINFDALEKLSDLREFIEDFKRASGVSMRLVPPSPVHSGHSKALRAMATKGEPTPRNETNAPIRLRQLSVPLIVGGNHVAALLSDPIAVASVSDRRLASEIQEDRVGGRKPPLRLTEEQFDAFERLITVYAGQFSALANHQLTAKHPDDPLAIAKAKEYIGAHAAEPITVRQVARHVHSSVSHFSRLFSKTTGMTFTEYLSRVRVVRAEELLAEPAKRIADVAFASGFESVPYFNRVFKSCTGKTPGHFRMSLRGVEAGAQAIRAATVRERKPGNQGTKHT